jgi:hypothetical protein
LYARDLEAFTAAQVLAHNHVIAAHHVGASLGKLSAVTLIGAPWKLLPLGTNQPGKLIFVGLVAVGTVQGVSFLGFFLVKEIAFVHINKYLITAGQAAPKTEAREDVSMMRFSDRPTRFCVIAVKHHAKW